MSSKSQAASEGKEPPAARRKSRWRVMICGAAVALTTIAFWRPLQTRSLVFFILRSEAPSEQSLEEAASNVANLPAYLTELWETGRFPHRLFAISFIKRSAAAKPDLFGAMESVVIQAADDVDLEVRQLAFEALRSVKHPKLRSLALQQLSDKDPAARLIGAQALRHIATTNDVPIAMELLSDPEPRVVVAAAQILRAVISVDFDMKSSLAMPQFTFIGTSPPPLPDLPSIKRGVERWQAWWREHQAEFPAHWGKPQPNCCSPRLAMRDFRAKDAGGHEISPSDLKGKVVLLVFWSGDMPESLDISTLRALQTRDPDNFAVLSVCVPPAPSCADEHEHGHADCHEHATLADGSIASSPEYMRAATKATVRSANFPILSDPTGALGLRFSVDERPTYVLIDSDGAIRRRFAGVRSEFALQAMADELRPRSSSRKSPARR